MAQTYTQIQRQIEALQKQAEKLKHSEVSGVVARIKEAIEHYGLTPDQLFGASITGPRQATSSSAKALGKTGRAKIASSVAYADGAGNTWGGRGPRPRWLRDALATGKTIDEFAATKSATPTDGKKVAGKRIAKRQYRDKAGYTWSGFGPKPRWLREALEAGATLDQFAA